MTTYEEWRVTGTDVSRAHEEALAIATAARELALMSRVSETEAANAIVTTIVAYERTVTVTDWEEA